MAFRRGKGKEVIDTTPVSADEPERISNKLEHTLVADNKIQPKERAKRFARRVINHRRFKPAAIALVVIIALSGLAIYLGRDKQQPTAIPDGPKCSYAVLEKAKPLLSPKKADKLEKVVADIEQIPGYDQDANCLFVVITYYMHISDAVKTREVYGKLEKAYDPGEGYETIISEVAKPPKDLRPAVEFLEKQAVQYKNVGPDGAPR